MRKLFAASLALLVATSFAKAADPLPKAETVLDDYITATGGKAAYEKIKNRRWKGKMEVVGTAISGSIVSTQAEPNKTVTEINLGGIGKISEGSDGSVAWSSAEITGDRVLDGEEKARALAEATFHDELNWREKYVKAECVGIEDIDGKPAYKLIMTPKQGSPVTSYYDKASHLLLRSTFSQKGPMGEMSVVGDVADYKKVDGILIPHTSKNKVLQQEMVITLEEVKHNVDLPADTFKLPKGIQEIVDKSKAVKK
jgi:hypothetical protein